jgi:capsular polysaccharide biosynthesis protein
MKKQNEELTLKDILNIFLPKLWFLVLVAIVCAAVLGTMTAMKKDTFTAESTFMMVKVPVSNSEATNTGLNAAEIEAMQNMISSSKFILESTSFCQKVRDMLVGYEGVDAMDIRSMLSVSLMEDSTCFSVSTRTVDPQLAKDVADVVHKLLPEDIMERLPYAIKISTLDYPEIPAKADGKNVTRNALIGGIAGALLAAVAVFLFAKFDVVIRTREKIEDNFSIPILGVIPRLEADD